MTQNRGLLLPLAAVTPPRHMAHLVASRSYLSYQKAELQDKLKHNPFSYIQVINPDASRDVDVPRGTPEFFQEVRNGYCDFKDKGWLETAPSRMWYVYRQSTAEDAWTGVICNLDLSICSAGALKTHEQTLASRELLFASFLENVGFHAEPILCARPDDLPGVQEADEALAKVTSASAHTDFMTADGIRHEIWCLAANSEEGKAFQAAWGAFDSLYLADGHHRLASSLRLAERRPDLEGAGQILAYVVPQRELTILGYHKELRELRMTVEDVQLELERALHSNAERIESTDTEPSKPGELIVHFQGATWRVRRSPECSLATDADWCNEHLLGNAFGIHDPRNDERLRHLPETQRPEGGWGARARNHPERLIIIMHPLPFGQIRKVADQGSTLPPKSTWVEPKIRSALFIHEFNP